MQVAELAPRWYDLQNFHDLVELVAQFHLIALLRALLHVLDSAGVSSSLYDKADFVDHDSHLPGRLTGRFSGQVDKTELER
jgi:hypothetical protein